ncbi:MAG: heavy metal-associated domain-containing protein [Archaeoglobaceae archaeon]
MLVKLSLKGLKCRGCMRAVKVSLEENGAIVREISLKEVEIEIPENERVEKFVLAVEKAGYSAKIAEIIR